MDGILPPNVNAMINGQSISHIQLHGFGYRKLPALWI
jgi:hypothetical protein